MLALNLVLVAGATLILILVAAIVVVILTLHPSPFNFTWLNTVGASRPFLLSLFSSSLALSLSLLLLRAANLERKWITGRPILTRKKRRNGHEAKLRLNDVYHRTLRFASEFCFNRNFQSNQKLSQRRRRNREERREKRPERTLELTSERVILPG